MTKRTIGGVYLLGMVRIRGGVIVGHVAGLAIRRCSSIAVRMALVATRTRMLARQREPCAVVIECRRYPGGGLMALCAVRREAGLSVVRRRSGIVVSDMAGLTCSRCTSEPIGMTLHAIHGRMCAR